MDFTANSEAQCGECGIRGPLNEIKNHYRQMHCDAENLNVEAENNNVESENLGSEELETEKENNSTENFHWKDDQVLLLIRLMEKHDEEFNKGLKKHVWIRIAAELTKVTNKKISYEQVDAKWKGLKKTYKKIKDHNSQTGNSLKRWQFFYAIDSFYAKKPEVQPQATCTSTSATIQVLDKTAVASTSCKEASTSSRTKKRKSEEVKNEVQKRHNDKIKRYDKFLKIFQKSVEHQTGSKISDDEDDE